MYYIKYETHDGEAAGWSIYKPQGPGFMSGSHLHMLDSGITGSDKSIKTKCRPQSLK